MEIQEVDPYEVNVDEMNERTENLELRELEKSVEEQGVVQPPIVRRRNGDAEVPYSVVVGQRRTMAAQGAGLDSIPVVVMDWGDAEALEASITENVDTFRKSVSKKDRAVAIERLKKMKGWTDSDAAVNLGVAETTVRNWLEYTRDEWEGTTIHADNPGNESTANGGIITADEVADAAVQTARRLTGGGESGERVVKKFQEKGITETKDIREVKQVVESRTVDGQDVDVETVEQAIDEVAAYKQEQQESDIRVYVDVTFTGEAGDALTDAAKDRGATKRQIVREAIEDYLEREGFL